MELIDNLKFIRLYDIFKGYTMMPKDVFVGNLKLIQQFRFVEGCVVECGVWRGGMISAMAKVLGDKRKYYLFDSFEGLPSAKKIDGKSALEWQKNKDSPLYFDNCRAEERYAREAMVLSGVRNYQIVRGWFSKSLLKMRFNHNIAVLRLDADWYDPTMKCLVALYDHIVRGGIIIIDDYYTWEGCSKAVHKFLTIKKGASRLYQSKNGICYILKY
jgi:hypothetical protein